MNKPQQLRISRSLPPAQPVDILTRRHGPYKKGDVLPETQVEHSPKCRVADFPKGFIPPRLYERNLEQDQLLKSCCRHPENHKIKAKKSHPDEARPDIYIFYCHCGCKHRVFCVGLGDDRPEWK